MPKKIWTDKILDEMKALYLPSSGTIQEAVERASKKFRSLQGANSRTLRDPFTKRHGENPSTFLQAGKGPKNNTGKTQIWTKERLEEVRDEILPTSRTLSAAVAAACEKFGCESTVGSFQSAFRNILRASPSSYLAERIVLSDDSERLQVEVKLRDEKIRRLSSELANLRKQSQFETNVLELLGETLQREPNPPDWITNSKTSSEPHHGIPTLFLSDIHFDETVYKDQVDGWNEYNRDIAKKRLEHIFEKTVFLLEDVFTRATYPGIICALGGDMLSGLIHEEIRESNGGPIFIALEELLDILIAGIELLHNHFGRVFLPCVVGNHGRIDRKPRIKNGPYENFEWILYRLLARHFKQIDGVDVHVPSSLTAFYKVFGSKFLLTHGDSFRGGTGISGALLPWMLGHHRLQSQRQAVENWTGIDATYDYLMFGHWHQYAPLFNLGFVANGSVKGYDEFSKKNNFRFEPPVQALFMTHPEYRVTFAAPVHAESREPIDEEVAEWVSLLKK